MKKDDKVIKLFDEEGNEVKFNVVAFFDIVNPETDEKTEYVTNGGSPAVTDPYYAHAHLIEQPHGKGNHQEGEDVGGGSDYCRHNKYDHYGMAAIAVHKRGGEQAHACHKPCHYGHLEHYAHRDAHKRKRAHI